MRRYIHHWSQLPEWDIPISYYPKTALTVLIPARNEANNIGACIQTIIQQDYPKELLEVIVIDDHSTDETAQIVQNFNLENVKVLALADFVEESNTKSFKKRAIEIGLAQAKGQLILSTDADCIVPRKWLSFFASYYQAKDPVFIAAPVNFYQEKNLLQRFQSLDFVGMMGITGAGIHGNFMRMCNGANLAYPKHIFEKVGGFEGIDHVASGDDMLLMQKIASHCPDRIGFIKNKDCTVLTEAKPTWRSFLNQRIRWASKSSSYTEWKVTFNLAMVFFFCVSIVVNFVLIPFSGIGFLYLFLFQIMIKMLVDFALLLPTSRFFARSDLMRSFLPSVFLHLFYIVVVGFMANLKKEYVWKGRKTK